MAPPRTPIAAVVVAVLVLVAGCGTDDPVAQDQADTAAPAPAGTDTSTPTTSTPSAAIDDSTPDTAEPAEDAGSDEAGFVRYRVEVVATHPHDTGAYTQGLEVVDGLLLESTGLRGESSLRVVEPTTGRVIRSVALDPELFGEGATVVGDEVWQLTWTSEQAIVHGLDDLAERRRVAYRGEGWGLCATPERLVMSDGSNRLTFRDPATFDELGSIEVTDEAGPVAKLNELECVDGMVWANVYQTTRLVVVDPDDGRVVGEADLSGLVPPGFEGDGDNVANGIANDPDTGRFWLTGKRWPVTYEVELVPES